MRTEENGRMHHIDSNKLIAEFMELEYAPKDKRWDDWFDKNGTRVTFGNRIPLLYHTSWDWLMPVVESIFERLDSRDDSANEIKKGMLVCSRNNTYKAVVEFIEEYNK
jgi:hypothetical protein